MQETILNPDIVIIRDSENYRLLHGHLHLASAFHMSPEVKVEVKGEGLVDVVKSRIGYLISREGMPPRPLTY